MLSSRITVSILSAALGLMSVSALAAQVGGVGVASPPAATSPAASDAPATLDQLSDPDSQFYDGSREQGEEGGIRQRTLEEAARGVGIRGGYADEARRINDALERQFAPRLNKRFTFSSIMLREGTVVPPVVTLMTSVEETSGDSFLYTSVGAYEIVKDARVAIKTPTWREWPFTARDGPPLPAAGAVPEDVRGTGSLDEGRQGGMETRHPGGARGLHRLARPPHPRLATAWSDIATCRPRAFSRRPASRTEASAIEPRPMVGAPSSTKRRSASPSCQSSKAACSKGAGRP